MKYRGVCVGGRRQGQKMAHDHRERIHDELHNDTFVVTGPNKPDNQWVRTGKYVYDARHEPTWNWVPDKKTC
jgi:hypothetical protein